MYNTSHSDLHFPPPEPAFFSSTTSSEVCVLTAKMDDHRQPHARALLEGSQQHDDDQKHKQHRLDFAHRRALHLPDAQRDAHPRVLHPRGPVRLGSSYTRTSAHCACACPTWKRTNYDDSVLVGLAAGLGMPLDVGVGVGCGGAVSSSHSKQHAAWAQSLPALKTLKNTLDNTTFAMLSACALPALRNLSLLSADFSSARRFFVVHGEGELGHASAHIFTRPVNANAGAAGGGGGRLSLPEWNGAPAAGGVRVQHGRRRGAGLDPPRLDRTAFSPPHARSSACTPARRRGRGLSEGSDRTRRAEFARLLGQGTAGGCEEAREGGAVLGGRDGLERCREEGVLLEDWRGWNVTRSG
ncbi:hypothetical protein C8R45DRAFT_1128311 [Mycena sanguinolenta]|nr:hypothetical protein C8R45DRAFT_1128311 [Mycena sanguinolenta]